jgi:DNA-binding NarL/FixJ family response regulator
MDAQSIRVALVDDHLLVRTAIARLLATQDDLTVVGTAPDVHEAVPLVLTTRPDVVLMDVSMPGVGGIAGTELLCRSMPELRVVMLSSSCGPHQVRQAFAAGACGYLLKDTSVEQLYDAVRCAAAGGRPLAPLVESLGWV